MDDKKVIKRYSSGILTRFRENDPSVNATLKEEVIKDQKDVFQVNVEKYYLTQQNLDTAILTASLDTFGDSIPPPTITNMPMEKGLTISRREMYYTNSNGICFTFFKAPEINFKYYLEEEKTAENRIGYRQLPLFTFIYEGIEFGLINYGTAFKLKKTSQLKIVPGVYATLAFFEVTNMDFKLVHKTSRFGNQYLIFKSDVVEIDLENLVIPGNADILQLSKQFFHPSKSFLEALEDIATKDLVRYIKGAEVTFKSRSTGKATKAILINYNIKESPNLAEVTSLVTGKTLYINKNQLS